MINYNKLKDHLNNFSLKKTSKSILIGGAWAIWLYAITYIRLFLILVIILTIKEYSTIEITPKFFNWFMLFAMFYVLEPIAKVFYDGYKSAKRKKRRKLYLGVKK